MAATPHTTGINNKINDPTPNISRTVSGLNEVIYHITFLALAHHHHDILYSSTELLCHDL